MVQFSLPQNSKIEVGSYFKDKTNSKKLKKINVYRWDPSTGKNPRIDTYEVDMDNCGPKVLDILFKIKNEIDPSLTFRRSCAHGVCGSCAMNIDGVNGLACIKSHTDISGDLNIYPLPHLKVVKDLIGDLTILYKQYESIQPWLKVDQTGKEKTELKQSQKDREKLDGYYECILCACCLFISHLLLSSFLPPLSFSSNFPSPSPSSLVTHCQQHRRHRRRRGSRAAGRRLLKRCRCSGRSPRWRCRRPRPRRRGPR